jgi:TolB-like protein/tetratricopeptide (TPR) repeat protein/tRNA A-37 threonylcarbamoyl transferase component Bud32
VTTPLSSPASLRPGDVLAERYVIERPLGQGGMATVYLAEERKHSRRVAVKVLNPELSRSLGTERFLREIRIAAGLSHPYILPLIDSGEADGWLFYVSAYVAGGSLRDRLSRERTLPLGDALRVAGEVGAALESAHRNGYLHRDVKPENILMAEGHALLADFGVAFVRSRSAAEALTSMGLALGTPEYMSPEQASGERDLGVPSDVYSLACVIFEMLTGAPPFRGPNARATMAMQVTKAPPSSRTSRPELPASLDRVLVKALAKAPEDRYASVGEFVRDLEASAIARLSTARAAPRTIAVLPFVNASPEAENEYLSDGITDELIVALAKVEGLRIASRTSVFALKGKAQDVRAIGALLGASVVLEGTVRKAGERLRITAQLTSTDDGQLLWSQRYDRTLEDVFAIQDEIANTIVSTLRATTFASLETPVTRRHTENVRAHSLYLRGRHAWNKRTQEGVFEAINFFEQAIAEDPGYALAYTGLADSFALLLDYRSVPVGAWHERAKEYARKALALDESLAEAHTSLAWSLFIYDWDWEAASAEFRRAIELDPKYATAHQWHAFSLASRGRLDEALLESHVAQELDPASVSIRRTLGWTYFYARKYEQASYHLARAIEMNPEAEETYRVLGLTLAMQGDLVEASRVLREAITLRGAGSYAIATLAYVLARSGNREEALAHLRDLEQRADSGYVSPVAFATLYIGLGDVERALDWTERAREERRGWVAYLRVNPIFDPLRESPRFQALLEKMEL